VHDVYKSDKQTFADELQSYSNEGLIEFEKRLSSEMQGVMPNDSQYDELLTKYHDLLDELTKRGLFKMPF